MDELRELYQQIILDHNKNPKNFKQIKPASHTSEGYNPLCGDRINLYLQIEEDVIKDIGFQGSGCAISKASASVMTTVLRERSLTDAKLLFKNFQSLLTGGMEVELDVKDLGKLAVFAGVRKFPVRIKCALLAWHTMLAALENKDDMVTTE